MNANDDIDPTPDIDDDPIVARIRADAVALIARNAFRTTRYKKAAVKGDRVRKLEPTIRAMLANGASYGECARVFKNNGFDVTAKTIAFVLKQTDVERKRQQNLLMPVASGNTAPNAATASVPKRQRKTRRTPLTNLPKPPHTIKHESAATTTESPEALTLVDDNGLPTPLHQDGTPRQKLSETPIRQRELHGIKGFNL